MNCKTANNEILIAELEVLAGVGDSALAEHVRSCADCRTAAQNVLVSMAAAKSLCAELPARRRRSRTRLALVAALPIAAAVVWMVFRKDRLTAAPIPTVVRASADPLGPERHVSVDLAPGRSAIVMKTADPRVTVVWLSPGVGQ